MRFTVGSSPYTAMQQVLDGKVASILNSRRSSAFPLHIAKGMDHVVNSVAKVRPKPDADYAMKLLAKVLRSSFNLDPANTRCTAHLGYHSPRMFPPHVLNVHRLDPSVLWLKATNFAPKSDQVPCLRLYNFVEGAFSFTESTRPIAAYIGIGNEGRVLKKAVHACRCSFKEVSMRQRAKMPVAKMQLQQYARQVPRRFQQPRGHTTNVGRHPRGGQRISRASGQR